MCECLGGFSRIDCYFCFLCVWVFLGSIYRNEIWWEVHFVIIVGSMSLVFLVVLSACLMSVCLLGFFLQDGKHGKAWGIVHKEGKCISLFLMCMLMLIL